MKSKKIISLIAATLTIVTLAGCNFGKKYVNKEKEKKEETKIGKQEENNTEFDKKADEETEDKKSTEEETEDIKKIESDKDKVNIESKKESKSDDLTTKPIESKKKDEEKPIQKKEYKKDERKDYSKQNAKKDDKTEVKKDYPKQSEKKEPVKEKKPEPKKNISQAPKPQIPKPQVPKQVGENFIAEIEQIVFRKVNEERARVGIAPLSYNYTMQKYARDKSKDMGVKNYFSHEDLQGKFIRETMKRDGVSFSAWGENIGYVDGYTGNANIAKEFMITWMNSSGHRKNILSQNFKSIGIGVFKIGNKYYATQEFYR